MADEGKWEVVNNKAKKKAKDVVRKEKKEKEEIESKKLKSLEDQKRKEMKQQFYDQYVKAKGTEVMDNAFDLLLDEEELTKLKNEKKERKKKLLDGEFEGEELNFDFLKEEKKKKEAKLSKPKTQKKTKEDAKKETVSQAISRIDGKSITEFIKQASQKYPNNTDIQLKSLAEFVESAFTHVDLEDKFDYPISSVPKETVNTLKASFEKTPDEALVAFFWFLVTTIISIDTGKETAIQTNGVGLRLLLQILAANNPNVLLKNIPTIRETYTRNRLLPSNLVPIFNWIVMQTVTRQPHAATTAWYQIFLPLIKDKSTKEDMVGVSVNLIEQLVNLKRSVHMEELSASVAFEDLLLYKYSESNIPPRMKAVLPSLLDPSFFFPKGRVPRKFFGMLLTHAASEKEALRVDVLSLLAKCLAEDSSIFPTWAELYSKHIPNSNNLMLYVYRNWEQPLKIQATPLVQTAQEFLSINKQLRAGTYADKKTKNLQKKPNATESKEIEVCASTCEAVIKKLAPAADREKRKAETTGGVSTVVVALPFLITVGAGLYYTYNNCCHLPWCKSIDLLRTALQC